MSSFVPSTARPRVSPKVRTLQGKDVRASLSFLVRRSPRLSLASCTLVLALMLALASCSLLSLPLPQWHELLQGHWQATLLPPVYYSPLVPVALLGAALLGLPLGLFPLAALLLMAAIGLPVWTWGGTESLAYIPEGGYWAGLVLASLCLGWFTGYWLTPGKPLGWSLVSGSVFILSMVFLVHACGALTLLGLLAMGQLTGAEAQGWLGLLSSQRALWDGLLTLGAFALIKPLRILLRVFLYD
jgi:biotin transporter BioY